MTARFSLTWVVRRHSNIQRRAPVDISAALLATVMLDVWSGHTYLLWIVLSGMMSRYELSPTLTPICAVVRRKVSSISSISAMLELRILFLQPNSGGRMPQCNQDSRAIWHSFLIIPCASRNHQLQRSQRTAGFITGDQLSRYGKILDRTQRRNVRLAGKATVNVGLHIAQTNAC